LLQSAKKTSDPYITLLLMRDASSNPKSFRVKVSHLKWLAWFTGLVLLFLIGSLIYYYLHAYKVFYYDDLQKKYDQLAVDNERIRGIEREYRRVKQENEKIRLVFGILGKAQKDTSDTSGSRIESNLETGISSGLPADDNPVTVSGKSSFTATDADSKFWTPDYLMSSKVVPSIMPVNSKFIAREFSNKKYKSPHLGVDIVAEEGALVKASAEGWVLFAEWLTDYGNTIIIYHGFGYFTVYKHTQHLLCSEGLFVKGGDPIATVGKTGLLATGTHLHFEIWKDGQALDPADYLTQIRDALSVGKLDTTKVD